jgi:hypothetical protein
MPLSISTANAHVWSMRTPISVSVTPLLYLWVIYSEYCCRLDVRLGLSRVYARYGMFNHHHFGSPVRCLLSREHCCLALLIAGYTTETEEK